jgi:hypothetical protein
MVAFACENDFPHSTKLINPSFKVIPPDLTPCSSWQ